MFYTLYSLRGTKVTHSPSTSLHSLHKEPDPGRYPFHSTPFYSQFAQAQNNKVIKLSLTVLTKLISSHAVGAVAAAVAVVVGPNVTRQEVLLAIGVGASGGLPTLCTARLERRAVSNFALLEFNRPKGTLGVVTIGSVEIVVTFLSRSM